MSKLFGATTVEIGSGGPRIITGAADPRAGVGVAAPIGTYYIKTGVGPTNDFFIKMSATDTDWIPLLANGFTDFFGDGSDGDLNVAGATNEGSVTSGHVFYNDLSIGGAGVYRPQGRIIFVRGTLTIAAGGQFSMTGNAAAGAGAGAATTGYLSLVGTAGGAGQVAAGTAGTNSAATAIPAGALTSLGGAGGTGNGGASAGGAAGTIVANTVNGSVRDPVHVIPGFSTGATQVGLGGGSGGGGGGGDGAAAAGGGGGGGGGCIQIIARKIINEGSIIASGGAGAAGTGANAGGGGGGGGGRILILTRSITGAGTTVAAGGAAGASGGGNGTAGTAGAAGPILIFPI